jgi:hypothetical protein
MFQIWAKNKKIPPGRRSTTALRHAASVTALSTVPPSPSRFCSASRHLHHAQAWQPIFLPLHYASHTPGPSPPDLPRPSPLERRAPSTRELYTSELYVSTSLYSQVARRCCAERACCKHMFQVFQMFHRYVVSVPYGCCISRSGCCICCNCCTRMLKASVHNVSSDFFRRMLQVCLFGCCICYMPHVVSKYLLQEFCTNSGSKEPVQS